MKLGKTCGVRLLILAGLVACTSTRQLSTVGDLRLRTPDHPAGFVVHTTERWNERIDPNTKLRFRNRSGAWTSTVAGRDLYVDHDGVWIDNSVQIWQVADRVRIEGMAPDATAQIIATRPESGVLEPDGDAWILSADRAVLGPWLRAIELAVARLDPVQSVVVCFPGKPTRRSKQLTPAERLCHSDGEVLIGDAAKLRTLRIVHSGFPLGTWSVASLGHDWMPPLRGPTLVDALGDGNEMKVGWMWDRVAGIEVENISGGKTLAGIVGTSALAVALAPVALLGGGVGSLGQHGGGGSITVPTSGAGGTIGLGGGGESAPRGTWSAELGTHANLEARPLFSTGARVRAIVRPTIALDGAAATRGDLVTSGAIAMLRFVDLIEIGGGARLAETRTIEGWSRSTHGVFHLGLHLPLDAGFRFALPIGFEISGAARDPGHTSKKYSMDMRFPWGPRYTSGRWFGTLLPATPSYLRLGGDSHGRWSLLSGAEVGASF